MPFAGLFDSFVNPGLLAGLALLSAPIILHLLNKRRFTVVEWAAMDFLLQAVSRNRRRLRIEDLLLLLVRMLVIGLLVFAVARPIARGIGAAREAERIVILDDSFSMEAADGTGSALAAARETAASIVEDAVGRSIPVSFWSGTRPELGAREVRAASGGSADAVPDTTQVSREAGHLLREIRAWEAVDVPLRLPQVLARLGDRLGSEKEPAVRSVVLVSDFKAADWFEDGTNRLRSEISAALVELKRRGILASLRWGFMDRSRPGEENVAVTGIRLSTDHPLAKVPLRIVVEVRNTGKEDRKMLTGALEVGEGRPEGAGAESSRGQPPIRVLHRIPLPTIEAVPAGKTASAEVEFTFEKAGRHLLVARMEADRLPRDDSAHAVAHVRDGLRVLAIDGDPGRGRFSGESGFVLAALAPRGPVPSGILPRRFVGDVEAKDLRDADVAFILNRPSISPAEKERIEAFVRGGGGVALFLGSKVAAEALNGLPFVPARLLVPKDAKPRARLRLGDPPHAAFEVFRGVEGSSLEQVGFDRYFTLEPVPGSQVAARYDDADSTPAVIELELGKGRAALFNLSADRDWNDWPTDPSYPIVLQEWVRRLAPRRGQAASILAGEVIAWAPAAGIRYSVLNPVGECSAVAAPAGAANSGGPARAGPVTFGATHRAGFYCVIPAAAVPGSQVPPEDLEPAWYACRRDARDSRLEPAGEERLRPPLGAAGVELSMGREGTADAFQRSEEGETWRWFAWGAGLFLLLELLCAWWFGRR